MRLDWQRRAVILFAVSLLGLSTVLVFFAVREVEREKLLTEREVERERQRLVEAIDARAKSLVGDAENRALQAFNTLGGEADPIRAAAEWKEALADLPLVSEVFLVDANDRIVFYNTRPLFLLRGEKRGPREVSRVMENDDLWKRAEAAEFRRNDQALAASLYQSLEAETTDPGLDALFLNRQARCYAKSGRLEKALACYQQQLRFGLPAVVSEGIPLEITALYQMGNLHSQRKEAARAAGTFLEIYQGLLDGKWPLSRSQFEGFRTLAETRFEKAEAELDPSLRTEWESRFQNLKKEEALIAAKTALLEIVGERLVPRMLLEAREPDAGSGKFLRIAERADAGLLLASFLPLTENAALGVLIDPEALARGLSLPAPGSQNPDVSLTAVIIDESGEPISDAGPAPADGPEKSGDSRLLFTGAFTGSFPPWTIGILRTGAGASENEFRFRRNIYVLTLAVVIAALFFGGVLAIRSTARELKLAELRSDFTATVSHEFRTPLMSIRYMSELLQRGRIPDESRRQQYYETITRESERLGRLVENLLDFSKIEAGMKTYKMEETDIAALAADVAARFREQEAIKDFSLETDIEEDLPAVPADKDSLSRAVYNLLDNAVKYSGANPRVVLRAWLAGGSVHLQVEDDGIGIAKSEQKKIFEKFYRPESAVGSDVKGSGIGLPLVEHVARAHGGRVLLESEPGQGTRVTIMLPAGRPEDRAEGGNG